MKTVDFGKNIFQFEISFKIDCISPDTIRTAAEHLVLEKRAFTSFGKDPQSGQSGFTKGTGTEADPLRQVRLSPDKINMWAGWHTPYETWQSWRNEMLREVVGPINLPLAMISYVGFQATLGIPNEKLKHADEVPELAPLLAFHSRYVPKEYFGKIAGRSAFGDELNTKSIEWWAGGTPGVDEGVINYVVRWMVMDEELTLLLNVVSLAYDADSLFAAFHSAVVLPLVRT